MIHFDVSNISTDKLPSFWENILRLFLKDILRLATGLFNCRVLRNQNRVKFCQKIKVRKYCWNLKSHKNMFLGLFLQFWNSLSSKELKDVPEFKTWLSSGFHPRVWPWTQELPQQCLCTPAKPSHRACKDFPKDVLPLVRVPLHPGECGAQGT